MLRAPIWTRLAREQFYRRDYAFRDACDHVFDLILPSVAHQRVKAQGRGIGGRRGAGSQVFEVCERKIASIAF